jgi:hypothetical protein
MEYRNGDVYTGTWDGANGKGLIAYTDGSSYEVCSTFDWMPLLLHI